MVILCFAGCTPVEEYVQQPTLKYDTVYPATEAEYTLTIDKKIVPMLNTLEGHMAKAKDVVDGKYPLEYELKSAKDTAEYLEGIYEETQRINPPTSCKDRHADTLSQMKRAVNAAEVYVETLQDVTDLSNPVQQQNITKSADLMESEFTSLKNMFNIR